MKENEVKVKIKGIREGYKFTFKSKVDREEAVIFTTKMIEDLKKSGFEITEPKAEKKEAQPESVPAIPVCPTHGVEMVSRKGQYGQFWACPNKDASGNWCKEKPPKKK